MRPSRQPPRIDRRLGILVGLLTCLVLGLMSPAAGAAPSAFDHFTTGFELSGRHADVGCQSCHVGGVFKGTPTTCVSCHAAGSRVGASAKPPTHVVSGDNCSQCHTPFAWRPLARFDHINVLGTCTTCHNRVQATGKPANHLPTAAECGACHSVSQPWSVARNARPANHIPTAPTATCENCHTSANFATMPTLANIHLYAPSTSQNCAQCHGAAAASFAIPAANFSIVGLPPSHLPTSASCESCHVGAGSSIAATPVPNGAKFSNSAMSHAGITTGCAACHGSGIIGTSFAGISKIVVLPPTSPAGAGSHIPVTAACETCHLAATPSAFVPANATVSAPGTKFASPAPTTAMIHTGISGNCAGCHEGGNVWMDMASYPLQPGQLSSNTATQYQGFQTRPGPTGGTYVIQDAAHPAAAQGDCGNSGCHAGNTNYFSGQIKPANHIPTSATATCANCHTTGNFASIPTIANIHLYAPSTTQNCAQCHGAAAASFAIPSANFSIVGLPTNHVPTSASCETCHVGAGSSIPATPVPNGARFSNSAMSHAGITTGCAACHGASITGSSFIGITKITVLPPTAPAGPGSHIPVTAACETCHLASTPSAFVPANATTSAPGTKFASPVPTTAMIHTGISGNCAACHEGGNVWMNMASYPIVPSTLSSTAGTEYTGFQTRPGPAGGTYAIKDAAHPTAAQGDCGNSGCHAGNTNYFSGEVKPSNHIPTSATATCANCHTTGNFATIPTIANIHLYAPSTTQNCAQCHGPSAPSYSIPSVNFSVVGLPTNHVPTSASCETCHVGAGSSIPATPVPNGAKFANSAMSHSGITTGCAACHGASITGSSFIGITKIIVLPPTSPAGAGSHIPVTAACETCHLASTPSAFVPANATTSAPGTKFASPAPTTAMIHTGISGNCAGCHEGGNVWMDMASYPIVPSTLSGSASTQYMGFQTRPGPTGGTYAIKDAAHPTAAQGDCGSSGCHGTNTNFFTGAVEPAGHIPTITTDCALCHTTAGNFAVYTSDLTALHTGVATTCSTCHADGKGPFTGAPGFSIVQMSTRGPHIPITDAGLAVECSGCHKSVTSFSGTVMSHGAIGDNGTSSAGNACDACHEYGFSNKFYGVRIQWTRDSAQHFICGPAGTPSAPNTTICPNGGSDCLTGCHQHQNNIPSKYKTTGPRKPVLAPANGAPGARSVRPTTGAPFVHAFGIAANCSSCHAPPRTAAAGAGHPATTGACADCHTTAGWRPVTRVDHADVLGSCASCHTGVSAIGKPPGHLRTTVDCDSCHTTTAWSPAAFEHGAVAGQRCGSCHDGLKAVGRPAAHKATTLDCASCHYPLAWTPVRTPAEPKVAARPPAPRPRHPGALPVQGTSR